MDHGSINVKSKYTYVGRDWVSNLHVLVVRYIVLLLSNLWRNFVKLFFIKNKPKSCIILSFTFTTMLHPTTQWIQHKPYLHTPSNRCSILKKPYPTENLLLLQNKNFLLGLQHGWCPPILFHYIIREGDTRGQEAVRCIQKVKCSRWTRGQQKGLLLVLCLLNWILHILFQHLLYLTFFPSTVSSIRQGKVRGDTT